MQVYALRPSVGSQGRLPDLVRLLQVGTVVEAIGVHEESEMKRKKRRMPLRPRIAEPWGTRIVRLLNATGWPRPTWKQHLGLNYPAIFRVMKGGNPSVELVRKLRELEEAYEEDLWFLEGGAIIYAGVPGFRGYWRFDGRTQIPASLRSKNARPADLSTVVDVAPVGETRAFGLRKREDRPPENVYKAPNDWINKSRDFIQPIRRPETE